MVHGNGKGKQTSPLAKVITLLTDFGLSDVYVGVVKGIILGINPQAHIVDLGHNVQPQNILQAAFLLSTAYSYFPSGTIHLVVVDPGVGGKRRPIIVKTPDTIFVAPDNGVLSHVIDDFSSPNLPILSGGLPSLAKRQLPMALEAISISNPHYWRHPVSNTFHGRDVFAPVAAHLSLGVSLGEFGSAIDSLLAFPVSHPEVRSGETIVGHVIYVDSFGNLVTDVKADSLPLGRPVLEVSGHRIEGISSSYEVGDELLAIVGSSGRLEVSAKNANAAERLGATVGTTVVVSVP